MYVPLLRLHEHSFWPATCVTAVSCTGMEGEICTAIQQSAPHFGFGLPFSSGGGLGVWRCIFSLIDGVRLGSMISSCKHIFELEGKTRQSKAEYSRVIACLVYCSRE